MAQTEWGGTAQWGTLDIRDRSRGLIMHMESPDNCWVLIKQVPRESDTTGIKGKTLMYLWYMLLIKAFQIMNVES